MNATQPRRNEHLRRPTASLEGAPVWFVRARLFGVTGKRPFHTETAALEMQQLMEYAIGIPTWIDRGNTP